MPLFDKYQELLGRPEGRPVGVANGQGQQPASFANPMLKNMAMTQMPLVQPGQPTVQRRQKPVNPGPPNLIQGQVNTLLNWAKQYGGGGR